MWCNDDIGGSAVSALYSTLVQCITVYWRWYSWLCTVCSALYFSAPQYCGLVLGWYWWLCRVQCISLKFSVDCRDDISGSAVHCTVCSALQYNWAEMIVVVLQCALQCIVGMILVVFHYRTTEQRWYWWLSILVQYIALQCIVLQCSALCCCDDIGGGTREARRGNQQPTTTTVILSPFLKNGWWWSMMMMMTTMMKTMMIITWVFCDANYDNDEGWVSWGGGFSHNFGFRNVFEHLIIERSLNTFTRFSI